MKKTYYWSLLLTTQTAAVCLWSRDSDETTSIVTFGPEVVWNSDDELVAAIDTSLTAASSEMPEDAGEPTKTVFGVMGSWVSEGSIKKPHLALIREICGKLNLSPVGFVVLPEALANEVKQNEGGPLSGILVGVAARTIEVTLFKLGTLAGTVEVGRSANLSEDVIEALSRSASTESLPSRFILYGASDSELSDVSSALSAINWKTAHEKLQFMHEPKIEIAGAERTLTAVCIAGSSEMGPIKAVTLPDKEPEAEISMHDDNVAPTDIPLNALGFAIDEDITKTNPSLTEEIEEENQEVDVKHHTSSPLIKKVTSVKNKVLSLLPHEKAEPHLPIERHNLKQSPFSLNRRFKRVATIGTIALVLLLGGVAFAWYALPEAQVTLFISPRTLTAHETFTFGAETDSPNIESRSIPAKVFTKTVDGEDMANATGSKTVGEKAVGKVTIRNGTSNAVKLPAGALLTGPNDLKFSLDESASVSAATSPTSPGTATIPATAAAIGSDYNVASGESMKVGNFLKSEIDAVAEGAFSGGSSRQITAVSKTDLDGLLKSLTDKLITQVQDDMSSEVSDGFDFVNDSITTKVQTSSFSHKVGDEAQSVQLNLTVEATAFAIPKTAIEQAAEALLSSQVPDGYTFEAGNVQTSFQVQKGAQPPAATVGFTAFLLPNINPTDVAGSISGKRFAAANDYLATIPGFTKASITITPAFPEGIRVLPLKKSRINVEIQADR